MAGNQKKQEAQRCVEGGSLRKTDSRVKQADNADSRILTATYYVVRANASRSSDLKAYGKHKAKRQSKVAINNDAGASAANHSYNDAGYYFAAVPSKPSSTGRDLGQISPLSVAGDTKQR